MSKQKMTKKYVMGNYRNIISVPYCELQRTLRYTEPIGYITRVEGWAADIYFVDVDTVIVTGYAPFGNYKATHALCERYEEKASNILEHNTNYELIRSDLDELITKFCHEAMVQQELKPKEREIVKDNLSAFEANFGRPCILSDGGKGKYVFVPANNISYIQYCYNVDYLNGWLYGAVQAIQRHDIYSHWQYGKVNIEWGKQ